MTRFLPFLFMSVTLSSCGEGAANSPQSLDRIQDMAPPPGRCTRIREGGDPLCKPGQVCVPVYLDGGWLDTLGQCICPPPGPPFPPHCGS